MKCIRWLNRYSLQDILWNFIEHTDLSSDSKYCKEFHFSGTCLLDGNFDLLVKD